MKQITNCFGKFCFGFGVMISVLVMAAILHPRISIQPEGVVICLLIVTLFMLLSGKGISKDYEQLVCYAKIRVGVICFLYLVLLYQCVFGNYVFSRNYGIDSYNFIPLKTIISYFVAFFRGEISGYIIACNVLGNLLLLAPLGFFLPYFFKRFQSFKNCFVLGGVCSFFIETIQSLCQIGSFDVDDVILNVIGVAIVYFVMKIPVVERILVKGKIIIK